MGKAVAALLAVIRYLLFAHVIHCRERPTLPQGSGGSVCCSSILQQNCETRVVAGTASTSASLSCPSPGILEAFSNCKKMKTMMCLNDADGYANGYSFCPNMPHGLVKFLMNSAFSASA